MSDQEEVAKEMTSNPCQPNCLATEQNPVVQPLLTDLYQLKMAYAYWKGGRIEETAVFDLFFRKAPFNGEFAIFAGLSEFLNFLKKFKYSETDILFLRKVLPSHVEEEFFSFLRNLDTNDIKIYALREGSIAFPRIPLMRVEGPLIVAQLLETTLLTLVNFASLITTNAARYRIAAGCQRKTQLLEFGLRRAQGPDGGLSASKYAYVGGFDGTSNILAGKLFDIPLKGTHAHAYVTSFTGAEDMANAEIKHKFEDYVEKNFYDKCLEWRKQLATHLNIMNEAHNGELAAFASYAVAFPKEFLALIDTYDVSRSGILNFAAVAMALNDLGYRALGVRIDSGDLAYLSNIAREAFESVSKQFSVEWFANLIIVASNDINEDTILSLNDQGHSIDVFGIGTHLGKC